MSETTINSTESVSDQQSSPAVAKHPIPPAANYPIMSVAPAGYAPTLELGVIVQLFCQAYAAVHDGQEPAKIWVPVPGQ